MLTLTRRTPYQSQNRNKKNQMKTLTHGTPNQSQNQNTISDLNLKLKHKADPNPKSQKHP